MMQVQSQEDCVDCLVAEILACYLQLSKIETLSPSPHVNGLFDRLTEFCCRTFDESVVDKVLTHHRIASIATPLRRLCSDGEYRLEAYWTEKILREKSRADASAQLLNFTYFENYVDLTRMEINAVTSMTRGLRPKQFAVLGSGPLPMTSICILQSLRTEAQVVTVHNFDHDPQAISMSSELCVKLGYSRDEIDFHVLDVLSDQYDMLGFDVVYLASLVGITDDEKQKAINNMVKQMRPGALLVIRSAHSLRGLLYPAVNITVGVTSMGLKPLVVVHPYNEIVNSFAVLKVVG